MKANAQELVYEALRRAVRREASMSAVEVGDLLWAIDSKLVVMQDGAKSIG
jgi:hypothetical protein